MKILRISLHRATLLIVAILLCCLIIFKVQSAEAAPIIVVPGSSGDVECKFEVFQDSRFWEHPAPNHASQFWTGLNTWPYSDDLENQSSSNLQTLIPEGGNNNNRTYLRAVAVNPGVELNDEDCANYGVLFQSQPDSNAFAGVGLMDDGAERELSRMTATYDPSSGTISITRFGDAGTVGPAEYDVNNPRNIGTLPSSGGGGGGTVGGGTISTGPCPASNPGCISPRFVNFDTIEYLGETYKLLAWRGDSVRYVLSSSPTRQTTNGQGAPTEHRPYFEFSTGTGSGQLDIDIDDGTLSTEIGDWINVMNSFGATVQAGRYQDKDANGNDVADTVLTNAFSGYMQSPGNLRRIFRYSEDEKVTVMRDLNPGGNEQQLTRLLFEATDDPLVFETQLLVNGCTTGGKARIVFSADPRTQPENEWRAAKFSYPSDSCSGFVGELNSSAIIAGSGSVASVTGPPAGTEDNSCEGTGGVLGWVMCPVAGLLDTILGFLDNEIQNLLALESQYFDTGESSGASLKSAWTQIRNIAYVILIPIMLVMVIGTALGFEMFSAYTIKKALPRMVIAVIFITLSWYICVFLVGFFNVIGTGIKGLVITPFTELADVSGGDGRSPLKMALDAAGITRPEGQDFGGWVNDITAGATLSATGLVATAGAFSFYGVTIGTLLSTIASAVLILGIAFIVLVARQMFIIAMVMLAPLAILAWIFPGNDKLWKLWWNSFSKLLMMFPLIMLLIGLGSAFGIIIGTARADQNDLITIIMIVAATVLPYMAIPFTFKFAGGVFGNLAGMVNDRNKGVLDRLKKGRADTREKAKAESRAGISQRFGQRNRFSRGLNSRVSAGWQGRYGFGKRGTRAMNASDLSTGESAIGKHPEFNQIKYDKLATRAMAMGNEAEARAELKRIGTSDDDIENTIAKVKGTVGFSRAGQLEAYKQMILQKDHVKDAADAAMLMAHISGDDKDMESSLSGFTSSYSKSVGRHDLSGIGSSTIAAARKARASGAGAADPALISAARTDTIKGFENADTYTLGKENKLSYQNMVRATEDAYIDAVNAHQASGGSAATRGAVVEQRTRLEEIIKNAGSATGLNAREATMLADRLQVGPDDLLRTVESDGGVSILGAGTARNANQGDAEGSVGSGGLARAHRQLSDAELAEMEAKRQNGGKTSP